MNSPIPGSYTPTLPITESLFIEMKRWLNLSDSHDIAIFCKSCIALYNNGGGILHIGFDDRTGNSVPYNLSQKYEDLYHPDDLQKLLGKHTSEPIPLTVVSTHLNGVVHPIITVHGGVIRPIYVTKGISDSTNKTLLDSGKIYIRLLHGNQYSSATPTTAKDWESLLSRCFNNREADLAGFIRRHFVGDELKKLRNALFPDEQVEAPPTDEDLVNLYGDPVNHYLNDGFKRFKVALDRRASTINPLHTWEVGAVVAGGIPTHISDEHYYQSLMSVIPILSGVPTWMNTRNFTAGPNGGAAIVSNAWEQIFTPSNEITQFGVLYEKPAFYLCRTYKEDLSSLRSQHDDPIIGLELQIMHVAEVIATLVRFAQVVREDTIPFSIGLKFHWRNLNGRKLVTFNQTGTRVLKAAAIETEVLSGASIPWDLADDEIYKYVHAICRHLFKIFDGAVVPIETTQRVTNEFLRN